MNGSSLDKFNDDLAFFGKVNASISHELKNILAIISEAAGLLTDLTEMAANGGDVQLEMLKNCSRDIVDEVQRGFTTIKQMNQFSHSVDDPAKDVDLGDCLKLMAGLAGFLSYACRIHYVSPENDSVRVFTRPFKLQHLIYQVLVFAFESAGPNSEIDVSLRPASEGEAARICFSRIGSGPSRIFPPEEAKMIAASIGAEFEIDHDCQTVDILIPPLEQTPQ